MDPSGAAIYNPRGSSTVRLSCDKWKFTVVSSGRKLMEDLYRTRCDDGPLFLGDGSLAGVPTPKLHQKGIRPVIKVVDDKCLVFDPPEDNPVHRFSRSIIANQGKRVKDQTFAFDRVFDEHTTQGDVYEATTKNLMDSVIEGYNATVFAYGATGCGKTHTITGTAQQPGIIFLTMQELFEKIEERKDEKVIEVSLSYLEIYNETIRDLLVPGGSKAGLMLREDANQAVSVAGLSSHHPKNVEEVMDMIMRGNECRTISPTEANATSSRSHAVLQINISQKDRNADIHEPHMMATLSIIDLAGSERASATKNRGDRLLEGANINKSLLALGSCINALCDPRKRNHVPYRNSKLTRLLKFSLGGNCKTVMIVCVSPSSEHFDETQNTLRYANRAKNIQTKVTRNVYNVNRHVKDFLKKIDEQMALINELQAQQKDYEGAAFLKFKKQSEKREAIAREGIARIRAAYENATAERQEKAGSLKKLRQLERRISMISAWVAAFDGVCDNREYEEPHNNLTAMRKSAQGILVELEGSRQHYHQKIAKSNWERTIDSALQSGVRQLREIDGVTDSSDIASLTREAELLKANAEREMITGIVEQEKAGDAAVMQVLLAAHFETVASVKSMLEMTEEEAVEAARTILYKIMNACSDATSQVIKPGGELTMSNNSFPNPCYGGPKRRKGAAALSVSPLKPMAAPTLANAAHLMASPMKLSPKRRKVASAKKGISFTPKKKSPTKRGVRWRDDTENGTLAEFEKTPQRLDASPGTSPDEPLLPPPIAIYVPNAVTQSSDPDDSSPIPPAPEPSIDIRPMNNRFKTGFLRKTNGSPLPPKLTNFSSDSDNSPLRDLEPGKAHNRSSLQLVESALSDVMPNDSGSNSAGSDTEWKAERSDAMRIKSAMKRTSAGSGAAGGRPNRRRSPTAASSSSPPGEGALFTASHARRMVKSEKENAVTGVLSPRTAPIAKPARRTTIGEGRATSGLAGRDAVRLSAIMGSGGKMRESSGMLGGKGAWR